MPLHVNGWFRRTPTSAPVPPAPAAAVSPATPVASDKQQPPKPSLFQRLTGKDKNKSTEHVSSEPAAASDVTNLSNPTLSTKAIDDSQPWTNAKKKGSYHYAILTIVNKKHFVFLARPMEHLWKYDEKGRPTEWKVSVCLDDISFPVVFGNVILENKARRDHRTLTAVEVEQLTYIKHPNEFFGATWKIETNIIPSAAASVWRRILLRATLSERTGRTYCVRLSAIAPLRTRVACAPCS